MTHSLDNNIIPFLAVIITYFVLIYLFIFIFIVISYIILVIEGVGAQISKWLRFATKLLLCAAGAAAAVAVFAVYCCSSFVQQQKQQQQQQQQFLLWAVPTATGSRDPSRRMQLHLLISAKIFSFYLSTPPKKYINNQV